MDIKGYIVMLNRNTKELLELVKGRDEAVTIKPSTGSWSVLQILEHLLLSENHVYKLIMEPSEKLADGSELKGVERLERLMVDMRGRKARAPSFLEPKGAVKTLEDFKSEFLRVRTRLEMALETGIVVVDERIHSHPLLGEMTVSDWLHFLISHARRHMEQIREILDERKGPEKVTYGY